jgi:hypothetical protein
LRGYDYVRRQAVTDVQMEELSATGRVRGTDPEPYSVKLQVTPAGFTSECSCPAFPKINGHCKHVAALLIALRDQVRPKQPRPEPGSGANGNGSLDSYDLQSRPDSRDSGRSLPGASDGPHPQLGQGIRGVDRNDPSSHAHARLGGGDRNDPSSHPHSQGRNDLHARGLNDRDSRGSDPRSSMAEDGLGGSRRARRRARKLAGQRPGGGRGGLGGGGGGGGRPGFSIEGRGHDRDRDREGAHGSGRGGPGHGVDAWLPEPMPPAPKTIEYRMQVRGGALSVSLLDRDAVTPRTPLSATALLQFQAQKPTADRDALRVLARLENEGPRRVGIEVRGEDAADLLPLLKGRRVILEPQMMELRFGDEPLRPRFDLELGPDGTTVLVKTTFQRAGDPRKLSLHQGGWFEGSPGWHVDEVVRDEEIPVLRQRADRLGPELDGVVAAGDEAHAVLVGLEAERAEVVGRLLLGGDVATDDGGALAGGEAARSGALLFVTARCAAVGGGLDEHGRRHAVGADVDLDVVVGGAQRDARLGESAAGAESERGLDVDDVGDLRQIGQLGADLERDAREALREERRQVVDRLGDICSPHQTADAARRDAAVDGARPALLSVDMPAGASLEPATLMQ